MPQCATRRRQPPPAIQSIGVGMPAAKAHRYLASFMPAGLIEQHPESGRYDLGPFALELGLGLAAMARLDPLALAGRGRPGGDQPAGGFRDAPDPLGHGRGLRGLAARARRQGVVRTGQFIAGISGAMEMALVALGYSGTFELALRGSLVRQVLASAQGLSARLGHRSSP